MLFHGGEFLCFNPVRHLLCGLGLLAATAFAAEARRPNFVVILSDDHAYRAIGYNNPVVKTPNMDRLAAEGLRFDRAFVASPICAASRASIYSGVFPQQHGTVGLFGRGFIESVVKGKRFATLPAVLGKAGSLRPILNIPTATVRDTVVSECAGPGEKRVGIGHRMARTDHFKYILSSSDEEAFFDLRSDPYEIL